MMRSIFPKVLVVLLSSLVLIVTCSQATAQQTENQEAQKIIKKLIGYRLEYLPNQKAADGRPAVRLHGLEMEKGDYNKQFVLKGLEDLAKHVSVSSVVLPLERLEELPAYLAKFPDLDEVDASACSLTPDLMKQLGDIKKLRSLVLSSRYGSWKLDDEAEEKVKHECLVILATMQQLRVLSCDDNPQVNNDEFIKVVAGLKNLESLNLSQNVQISDKGMKLLSQMTSLRKLWLQNVGFSDTGLNELKALTKLEELYLEPLDGAGVIDRKAFGLPRAPKVTPKALQFLQHLSELRCLHIKSMRLDPDEGLSFLRKMPKLENLLLEDVSLHFVNDVTEAKKQKPAKGPRLALSDFAEFKDLKELRHLSLQFSTIDTDAFEKKFPTMDKLESLQLTAVGLAGSDFKHLPQKTPKLKSLTVECLSVNNEDLPLLNPLKHLEYLEINSRFYDGVIGHITFKGLLAFQDGRPQVGIKYIHQGLTPLVYPQRVKPMEKDK